MFEQTFPCTEVFFICMKPRMPYTVSELDHCSFQALSKPIIKRVLAICEQPKTQG